MTIIAEYPVASKDFYVDDFISGAESVEEVRQLCAEVSLILRAGCFTLSGYPIIQMYFSQCKYLRLVSL